jgi:hypothetical protein
MSPIMIGSAINRGVETNVRESINLDLASVMSRLSHVT